MNFSSKHLLKLLKRDAKGIQLSIYLPTHPSSNSQALDQDITRFKNALKEAKNNPAYNEQELGDTVKSLYKLVDDVEFWKKQRLGLALFVNSDGYEYYHLPYEVTEATYVTDKFVVSPLAFLQSMASEFYVLDVNLTKPRLFTSNFDTLIAINEDAMPASFQDTIARDEYKATLQHMAAPRGSGGDNRIHGHGPEEALDHDTAQYLTLLADTVNKLLVNQDGPLLLMGEQSRVGNLRPRLKYEQLLPHSIDGNFETYTPQDLYDAAIKTMQDYETTERQKLVEQFLSSPPNLVVAGLSEITEAVNAGQIQRIYVPIFKRTADSVRPGNAESVILQLPTEIIELESVVRDTLLQGGEVVAVEIDAFPELADIKGLCRF